MYPHSCHVCKYNKKPDGGLILMENDYCPEFDGDLSNVNDLKFFRVTDWEYMIRENIKLKLPEGIEEMELYHVNRISRRKRDYFNVFKLPKSLKKLWIDFHSNAYAYGNYTEEAKMEMQEKIMSKLLSYSLDEYDEDYYEDIMEEEDDHENNVVMCNNVAYRWRCINLNKYFRNMRGWDYHLNVIIDNYLINVS